MFFLLLKEKKVELKASLIQELEHKKKVIENERNTMELTGGEPMINVFVNYFIPLVSATQLLAL